MNLATIKGEIISLSDVSDNEFPKGYNREHFEKLHANGYKEIVPFRIRMFEHSNLPGAVIFVHQSIIISGWPDLK